MDNGKYDFCSKKCLLNWLDKEEEFTKESEWYDR
jgi:YHS domain-containing protein